MKPILPLLLALALCLPLSPAAADYNFLPISAGEIDAKRCRVAASPEGEILVAWMEGEALLTRAWIDGALTPTFDHGPCPESSIAWNSEGFWLAWIDAAGLWVRRGDGATWEVPELLLVANPYPLHAPDLAGSEPPFFLEEGLLLSYSNEGGGVALKPRYDGGWYGDFVIGVSDETVIPRTQALVAGGSHLVFWATESSVYCGRNGYPPEPVGEPESLALSFAAAVTFDLETHVIANGPPPT